MKRFLSVGLLVTAALAMTGCEDLPGVLIVTKNFNVLVKGKEKKVPAGQHETSLDFKKDRVVATIKTADGNLKVELAVPKGAQIPDNGNFELRSSQTGQPFDILGAVQTKVTNSPTQTGYEACQVQDYTHICDPRGCHAVPIVRQGNRFIEFYFRDTDRAMQFDMTAISNVQDKYSRFDGRSQTREKVLIRTGPCF